MMPWPPKVPHNGVIFPAALVLASRTPWDERFCEGHLTKFSGNHTQQASDPVPDSLSCDHSSEQSPCSIQSQLRRASCVVYCSVLAIFKWLTFFKKNQRTLPFHFAEGPAGSMAGSVSMTLGKLSRGYDRALTQAVSNVCVRTS